MRPRQPRGAGVGRAFTLIELMVVIAIIAILAGTMLPIITQPFITERRAEAVREMAAIEEGIFGRPDLGDYGYLGTMGRMPIMTNGCTGGGATQALCELVAQGGQAGPALTNGVAIGWQGPYLRVATNQPLIDPWGQPYVLTQNPATIGQIQQTYHLSSNGPDRAPNTPDDIFFPLNANTWWNAYVENLQIDIAQSSGPSLGPAPAGTKVTLSYPAGNGGMGTLPVAPPFVTAGDGRATFASSTTNRIPFGMLSLTIDVGGTGGTVVTRQIVALKPVSTVQVVVPSVTSQLVHNECWISSGPLADGSLPACTSPIVGPLNFTLLPGQVIDASFTGGWHANGGGTCYAAITFGDILGGDLKNPSSAPSYGPAVTSSSIGNTTIATSRTWQYNPGGPVTARLMVQNTGGNCVIDGGSLSVRTWQA